MKNENCNINVLARKDFVQKSQQWIIKILLISKICWKWIKYRGQNNTLHMEESNLFSFYLSVVIKTPLYKKDFFMRSLQLLAFWVFFQFNMFISWSVQVELNKIAVSRHWWGKNPVDKF